MLDTLKIPNKTTSDKFNLQDFIDDLNALNEALDTLKGFIDTNSGEIVTAKSDIDSCLNAINDIYSTVRGHTGSLTSLIQSMSGAEWDIKLNKDDITDNKRRLAYLEETLMALNAKLNETKTFVRAYYGTDTPVLAGAWTDLVFPTISMDTLDEYNSSNGTITIKNPGTYIMNCTILFSKAVPGGQYFLEAVVGGAGNRFAGAKWGTNTSFMLLSGSLTINITAPDTTLKVRAFASSADTILGGTSYSFLQLARIN